MVNLSQRIGAVGSHALPAKSRIAHDGADASSDRREEATALEPTIHYHINRYLARSC